MKILYLNGADIEGGAARAAVRLLDGIADAGEDEARLHVQRKSGTDQRVLGPATPCGRLSARLRPTVEQALLGINPRKLSGPFCTAWLPELLLKVVARERPDILHLHWTARMMRIETLARISVPIIWTLHDSWPFTGGCYLPGDCTRYRESCGKCPVLASDREDDLSRKTWKRKATAWRGLNLTLIAPSRWMADCARSSSLFRDLRVEVIPNGIDTALFRPEDKAKARRELALPADRNLVLFGAKDGTRDPNKGFHLLAEALRRLNRLPEGSGIELVLFGSTGPSPPELCGVRTHSLGWQRDEARMALIYSAADVFVFPSLCESLGYTAMEAMACGTPCVAFNQGGTPDLVVHGENGYLAVPYEPDDLAHGIAWVLQSASRREEMSVAARSKIVQGFSIDSAAERHLTLYKDILYHER